LSRPRPCMGCSAWDDDDDSASRSADSSSCELSDAFRAVTAWCSAFSFLAVAFPITLLRCCCEEKRLSDVRLTEERVARVTRGSFHTSLFITVLILVRISRLFHGPKKRTQGTFWSAIHQSPLNYVTNFLCSTGAAACPKASP
jgi:hypothetical protein